jgi:tetratricopeptide (TPR) repeat protein
MRTRLFVLFVILMVAVSYLQYYYDSRIDYFDEKGVFVTLPSSKTLKIMSFGFQNLAADMLFIWSIQFYSAYHLNNRFDYIEHIYNLITDLNPTYLAPYFVGSWIMALEAGDYRMAIRLLEKGSKNNPGEWIFDHEAGFYAYKNLKDLELAKKFFQRAASKPGAPSHLRRRMAHMVYLQDDLVSAYNMWLEIAQKAGTRLEKDAALNHLYQIKLEIDRNILRKQIRQFEQKYNRLPSSLAELKQKGFIQEIPRDFQGNDYHYDPQSGDIRAQRRFKWKKFS